MAEIDAGPAEEPSGIIADTPGHQRFGFAGDEEPYRILADLCIVDNEAVSDRFGFPGPGIKKNKIGRPGKMRFEEAVQSGSFCSNTDDRRLFTTHMRING
ncbi:MAG: hypothetical protein PHF39_09170 [Methanoregula sp.]|nr:hypothetical protein [Methanoregula sp.]MDD5143590.1 hypothetical protein [Methanoregula sp.]